MLEKYYNMGNLDRLIRFLLGWAFIFLGMVYSDVINDLLLNRLVALFGVLNVASSIFRVCPAYLLARISTIGKGRFPLQGSTTRSVDDDSAGNRMLRRKLQFSVILPMLALLGIFAIVAHDLNHRFEMTTATRQVDVALELATSQHLAEIGGDAAMASGNRPAPSVTVVFDDFAADAELILHHDQNGHPLPSPFARIDEEKTLLNAWTREAAAALPQQASRGRGMLIIDGNAFIWSAKRVGSTAEWFTVIMKSPDTHTVLAYFLSPGFFVLIASVMWLAIWSSTYIVRIFIDRMEQNSQRLQHRIMHDDLTGLPNRQKTESIISTKLRNLNPECESVVLIMIDIIDFRVVNETLGYALGDQLLIQIGAYLQEVAPDDADVVRMGGDIFCLVAVLDHNRIHASRLVNEIHDKLECVHELDGIPVGVQLRTGLSLGPVDSGNPQDLIRFADISLAQAKTQRIKDCFYQHDLDSHSIRKLTLLSRLRTAIEQDELTLVYQPKVDIHTQTLAGVEVLVRWHDAEYGQVSPVEFVSWAEKSGLIDKLTHWVLTNAEQQCREWRDRGHVIPFAVNLSPTNLFDSKLIPLVTRLVKDGAFGNGLLELEITENAVMEDPEQAVKSMRVLNAMGVRFAIDDFGTGLSSFSYLRALPVDNLKIDRAFIMDTGQSDKDAILLRSMIELGHGLGCVVTAEGVEDLPTLERLREHGCDLVQGYHVCRPVPADELLRWAQSSEWGSLQKVA